MGLRHPQDMEAWRRWERPGPLHRGVAALRRRGKAPEPEPLVVALAQPPAGAIGSRGLCDGPGSQVRVLAVMDSASPSNRAAVLEAARLLPVHEVAFLGPRQALAACGLGGPGTKAVPWVSARADLPAVDRVLSIGAHLQAGCEASQWAQDRGIQQVVVQHGLLTPWAPPLPEGATLLSFTEQDGRFWASGRSDIAVRTVGSQALWSAAVGAAEAPEAQLAEQRLLVFLGQMHGRELPRRQIVGQTLGFLRREPQSVYRPHPSEKDALSRAIHAGMRRRGVRFQDASVPLASTEADVVSVFSTGVLEAAQRGRRAWVHHDDPPPWLVEFWDRYGLARWGQKPTRPVRWAETEPARAVADYLRGGTP